MARPSKKILVLGAVLLVLLTANLVLHWPSAQPTASFPPPFGATGAPPPEMQEKLEASIANLPADQRQAIEERLAADRAFFATLKDLPEKDRPGLIARHFADNPPPVIPGLAPDPGDQLPPSGLPGSAPGPDGPNGGPESGHIPPPEQRRMMDQHIADSLKNTAQ